MEDPPLILVSHMGASQKSFDCDCACAQQNHAPTNGRRTQANFAPLQRSAHLTIVPVDEAHEIVYHQTQAVGPVLVNRSARAVLDFFTRPDR